jgi:hypothetical protein
MLLSVWPSVNFYYAAADCASRRSSGLCSIANVSSGELSLTDILHAFHSGPNAAALGECNGKLVISQMAPRLITCNAVRPSARLTFFFR